MRDLCADSRTSSTSEAERVLARRDPSIDTAELLLFGTPRDVLARIVPGDPLGLRPLAADALRKRALVLDLECVVLRAFAVVAREAPSWRRQTGLGSWLKARVRETVDGLLAEEADALVLHDPGASYSTSPDTLDAFGPLARSLGLDPDAVGVACARFHALDANVREAFFLLVLEGVPSDRIQLEPGDSRTHVVRRARQALDVLRRSAPAEHPPSQQAEF